MAPKYETITVFIKKIACQKLVWGALGTYMNQRMWVKIKGLKDEGQYLWCLVGIVQNVTLLVLLKGFLGAGYQCRFFTPSQRQQLSKTRTEGGKNISSPELQPISKISFPFKKPFLSKLLSPLGLGKGLL